MFLPNTNHPLYRSKTHAEDAPEMADLYFAYRKALLENAVAQNSVLSKEQQQWDSVVAEGTPVSSDIYRARWHLMMSCFSVVLARRAEPAPNGSKIMSFSGDAEDGEEDPAVDLFAEVSKPDTEDEEEVDDADEAEPEDDFNAAWEVLDLAHHTCDIQKANGQE